MTNSAGQFIYFLEFLVNTSRYAVQINFYPLDTTIQSSNGYILPTGGQHGLSLLLPPYHNLISTQQVSVKF